ncbi:Cytochrome oxidase assembly [Batrachochytrium dendrobatidis]|nr:Cytochrome oxidase assembly [Batrachochytrium dendrobatidis]
MSQFFKRVQRFAKKSPIAAGIPFMGMIVAASYGFSYITQVKYDYIDAKYTTVSCSMSNYVCAGF